MRPHAPFAGRILFSLLLLFSWSVVATNHILRQDEIMAGLNGDPNVQFIQITVSDGTQKAWGPGPGESTSRAMLVFFNAAGVQTGQFFFPNNAPIGQNTVLIATTNFANLSGAPTPDFIIPPLLSPGSGKVCFRGNPANGNAFGVNLCLSYGNFPANQTEGGGPPAPVLPSTGEPMSLTRVSNFSFGGTVNSDFVLAPPSPLNTAGQTIIFTTPGPEIEVIPALVNFGSQITNSGASAPRSIVVTNRGVVNALNIINISLTGTHSNQFAIASDGGQNVLPAGLTRTVTVTFDPTSTGTKTAALRIVSSDENENILDVPLTGIGFDPNASEINVTPALFVFGQQNVTNGPTAATTITIGNQGLFASLFVTNILLTGPDAVHFQITSSTNASTVGPGNTRNVSVVFDPITAGPKFASLRIISNDSDEGVANISLQGRAVDLNPCTAPNPTNTVAQDLANNALLICPDFLFTGTTLGATADGASSCGFAGLPDVWFRYVPAANGIAIVSVAGIAFTPTISAHRSIPGTVANQVACGTGLTNQSLDAQMTFSVTNGVAVFVRVAGNSAVNSSFQLTLSAPACLDFDHNRNGVTDSCEFDFGDAPVPYPTTLGANGARHGAFTGVHLGELADSNDDGLPTTFATGDNEDGPTGNDEDGVIFTTPLIVGQAANLLVRASKSGVLNAWLDFNADRDWADASEQIFTNVTLQSGINALALNVPNGATITNLTFARFRFSTTGALTFTGAALDGEVEDYSVEILPASPVASALAVRINETMAGFNGDSTIQFVELEANGTPNKLWGPQGGETVGRAMLVFFDQAGRQAGRFVFPSNAPAGNDTVLIATRAFADATGLKPDFIIPPVIVPIAGKVAFRNNPGNSHFNINIALSYGGNGYYGATDGAGTANTNPLPILRAKSLTRTGSVPFGLNQNSVFQLAAPTPRNTAGQTATLNEIAFAEQGRVLFFRETFRGNGRTCATCHVPGRDQFGLTPITIAQLDEDDPLFVFEKNLSRLKLNAPSQPGDLRGTVTALGQTAQIFSGSGDTYLITGVTNFSGLVMDTNGNIGSVQSFARGNLHGPTASNGSERGLEDHDFLEHGRGLILENIDGFKRGEVFRASPHLLNLTLTSPFGLSGEFESLDDFSDGAVVQHFPTSLARVRGVDFRSPTREELQAMSEFMFGISNPATNQISVDRLATTEAQKRGRTIFFGDQGRCAKCHSGPAFNLSDGSLPDSSAGRNDNFNTGVANSMQNFFDNLPTEPAGLPNGQSARNFNTPSLMNIRLTAPFFHDGSTATLKDAIKFYDSEEFHNSPSGNDVGSLLGANKAELVDDLVAFLNSLVELPVEFTRVVSFGIHCPGDSLAGAKIATITNIGTNTITITNVIIAGTNAADFSIVADSGETNLAPGQTRSIQIAFMPATLGVKRATLEITAVDTNFLGGFDFGVALDGADVDNVVQSTLTSFDFGTRDIDAPPSPEESIVISNDGSTDLEIAIEVLGPNAADFTLFAETNAIPAHGNRVLQVAFAPQSQGVKSAVMRVRMISCTGTNIDIALAGVATSTVHHFAWDPITTNLFVGEPFPIRITAQDRNNETLTSFHGVVKLLTVLGTQTNTIQLTPTNSAPFANGSWTGTVTVLQPAAALRLMARDNPGHVGLSGFINVPLRDDVSITVTDSPDPVLNGAPITYVLTVSNTGPSAATGILVTNRFSPAVSFLSAVASQGTVTANGAEVVAEIGTLTAAATATVTITGEPAPGFPFVTNIASVGRNELESVLVNNRATNVTLVNAFGHLVVTPNSNFVSSGVRGGPFAPTNQFYSLSNAGPVSLNWQVLNNGGCVLPPGLVGWWKLDGTAADSAGTNAGVLLGNPVFANGFVGPALQFDGIDDGVRIPASPAINVGASNGFTIETWVNPATVDPQGPLVEWESGVHLWLSVPSDGGGPGSLYANIVSGGGNIPHKLSSLPGLMQSNVWQHVAVTYDALTGLAVLYRNGVVITQQNLGIFVPTTTSDLVFGRRDSIGYAGLMDDVGIYRRALSTAEIQGIFTVGASGKCDSGSGTNNNCAAPANLSSSWSFENNFNDNTSTNHGTGVGGAVFTNGFIGQGVFFDGVNDHIEVPGSPTLNIGAGSGITAETWINPTTIAPEQAIVEYVRRTGGLGFHFYLSQQGIAGGPGSLFANIIDINDTSHHLGSPTGPVQAGVWQHVAVTYDKATGIGTLFRNGVVIHQINMGSFTPQTSPPFDLFIGQRIGNFFNLSARLDELGLYNRALSTGEIASIFLAGTAGRCNNSSSWLSFAPAIGTLAPGAQTNVNVFITGGATNLKIGSYTDTLRFTNTSNNRGTTQRAAQLNVLNRAPTLAAIAPLTIAEDSGLRIVNLSGISAGLGETQQLTVTAISDNPTLITNPIAVSYFSPATVGSFSFTPLTNARGTAVVSVVVRDNGFTLSGGLDAVTNTFLITVTPMNDRPVLVPVPNQAVNEGALTTITNEASDVDLPGDLLTFSLPVAPTNAFIDPLTGVITWTPNELQGGLAHPFTVVVSDSGVPSLKATNQFILSVLKFNSPPVLPTLEDRVVHFGTPVTISAAATDIDVPTNAINYALVVGAPPGASLNASNGLFSWLAEAPVPSTNSITILAIDSGVPPLFDSKTFRIVVVERPRIESIAVEGTNVVMNWTAIPGARYAVQFKPDLSVTNWSELPGQITATNSAASKLDARQPAQRFYQIRVVP